MKEVPRLALYWHSLWKAGLIKVGSTRARLTPLGEQVLTGGQAPDAVARAMAVAMYTGILLQNDGLVGGESLRDICRATLVGAASTRPPSVKKVFAAEGNDPHGILPRLRSDIASWANDGLVTVGHHLVVPQVLRTPLSQAIKALKEESASTAGIQAGTPRTLASE